MALAAVLSKTEANAQAANTNTLGLDDGPRTQSRHDVALSGTSMGERGHQPGREAQGQAAAGGPIAQSTVVADHRIPPRNTTPDMALRPSRPL